MNRLLPILQRRAAVGLGAAGAVAVSRHPQPAHALGAGRQPGRPAAGFLRPVDIEPVALDYLAPLRIGVWVVALLVGTIPGWFAVRSQRITVDRARRRITMPGSIVPIVLMLAAFAGGFYFGYLFARYPELKADPATLIMAATYRGLMSGYFLGQTIRLFRLYRSTPQATVST